jgi:hypothetical protein
VQVRLKGVQDPGLQPLKDSMNHPTSEKFQSATPGTAETLSGTTQILK